jgi:hypothetical protein
MSAKEADTSPEAPKEVQYAPASSRYQVYECPNCDNVVLALGRDEPPMSCHDEQLDRVTDLEMALKPPDVRQVLLETFGLPKAALISACVSSERAHCRPTRWPSHLGTIGAPSLAICINSLS